MIRRVHSRLSGVAGVARLLCARIRTDTMGILRKSLAIGSIPLLLMYLVMPLLFFTIPSVMQHGAVSVKFPFMTYSNLSAHGIHSFGRNFYLREEQHSIGVWHVLPTDVSARFDVRPNDSEIEQLLALSGHPIVVYYHGNSFDRAGAHRCELYNVLAELQFHVLAIDYRGYGDSTGSPTEGGLVSDAHLIYEYAQRFAAQKNVPVYVWGHSMGTGVATRLVSELSLSENAPSGLVLESPFNNLKDVMLNHPFSGPYRWIPILDTLLVEPLRSAGLVMNTDERIVHISCPILILHAADDHIIPIKLARRLEESARSAQRKVRLVEFDAERRFKHKYICRAEELPQILSTFTSECSQQLRA
ncbi:hypothetical protein QR680_005640 [Steinernema hermaphroditum]|uniref:Serine aminopeptidase S33 domain-containing protein n=1 Tax=Steinernema hermaphroditum TaxID=289476 RepID=A0AA39LVR3_9BILA|nr:hypothetical protein QR680_005640 [Steinernema hermaphroditum]